MGRCEAVIDGEPGVAGVGKDGKQGLNVCLLIASDPASAVDDDGGGVGAGRIGHEGVEGEVAVSAFGEHYVFVLGCGQGQGKGQGRGEE